MGVDSTGFIAGSLRASACLAAAGRAVLSTPLTYSRVERTLLKASTWRSAVSAASVAVPGAMQLQLPRAISFSCSPAGAAASPVRRTVSWCGQQAHAQHLPFTPQLALQLSPPTGAASAVAPAAVEQVVHVIEINRGSCRRPYASASAGRLTRDIPACISADGAGRESQSQNPPYKYNPILVADDHPMNRMVIGRLLGGMGVAADFADDGEEALAKWEAGRHAVVLLDINMPRMGGIEACERILQLSDRDACGGSLNGRRPFVVAITADADEATRERCSRAGMAGFLLKPFRVEEFRSMVSSALQR
eukprot:tig00000670_g3017.t1